MIDWTAPKQIQIRRESQRFTTAPKLLLPCRYGHIANERHSGKYSMPFQMMNIINGEWLRDNVDIGSVGAKTVKAFMGSESFHHLAKVQRRHCYW